MKPITFVPALLGVLCLSAAQAADVLRISLEGKEGVPTPVAQTRLRPPSSRMGPADDVDGAARASALFAKYGTRVDPQSAREMLAARMEKPSPPSAPPPATPAHQEAARATGGGAQGIGSFLASRQGKAIERQVVRGVFGLLKKSL